MSQDSDGAGATLRIKGWQKFQHYKDRSAPWVKLYRDLLTSESWVLGTDLSRCVQIASTLLAVRYDNATPYNFRLLRQVMSLDCTAAEFDAAVAHLVTTNYLEIEGKIVTSKRRASKPLATCTSEREERENRGEEKVPSEPMSKAALSTGAVNMVFQHWQQTHGHPTAKLDDKRRRLIRAALSNYTADELCQAISGYLNSPHHMGQNDRSTKYDGIELMLRDAQHIDAGIKFHVEPPSKLTSLTKANIARTVDWVPPELRHANG